MKRRTRWVVAMTVPLIALLVVVILYPGSSWTVGVVMGLGFVIAFAARRIEAIDEGAS